MHVVCISRKFDILWRLIKVRSLCKLQPQPWFWSDQYEFKLQMAGLSEGFETCVERPGGEKAFSLFYYRDGRLIAVDLSAALVLVGPILIRAANGRSERRF